MNWLVDADVTEPQIVSQVQVASSTNDVQSVIKVQGQAYRVHVWTTTGEIRFSTGGEIEVLCVGGGGAGGSVPTTGSLGSFGSYASGGGGGGGGVVEAKITVTSDAGGLYYANVGASGTSAQNGQQSSFEYQPTGFVVIARGGGRGGGVTLTSPYVTDGQSLGSGGGGSALESNTLGQHISDGGDRFFGQGNLGADAVSASVFGASKAMSGGGGGASQSGQMATNAPPNGGNGVISSITGTPVFYGGGGAGGYQEIFPLFIGVTPAIGGIGGGGSNTSSGRNGANGFGGGGVGALVGQTSFGLVGDKTPPGNGGSGIVIIRYPIEG